MTEGDTQGPPPPPHFPAPATPSNAIPAVRLVPPSPPAGAPQARSPLAESRPGSRRRGDPPPTRQGARRPATPFVRSRALDESDEDDNEDDADPARQGTTTSPHTHPPSHPSTPTHTAAPGPVLNLTVRVPRGASLNAILAQARAMVPRLPDAAFVVLIERVWSAPVLAVSYSGWRQSWADMAPEADPSSWATFARTAGMGAPLLVPATHGIVNPGAGMMLPIIVVYDS